MWMQVRLSYIDHGYVFGTYTQLYELVSYWIYMQPNEHNTCKRYTPKVYFLIDTSFFFFGSDAWKHEQATLTTANDNWPRQCRGFLKGLVPYNNRFVKIQDGE